MGHLRVTIGHLRVTVGHHRVTIGYLVHIRVTLGNLRREREPVKKKSVENSTLGSHGLKLLKMAKILKMHFKHNFIIFFLKKSVENDPVRTELFFMSVFTSACCKMCNV